MRQIRMILTILIATIILSYSGLVLVGCNTVKGAGQDIENAGDAIHDTAQDAQH